MVSISLAKEFETIAYNCLLQTILSGSRLQSLPRTKGDGKSLLDMGSIDNQMKRKDPIA
jgi:hypothetical protein